MHLNICSRHKKQTIFSGQKILAGKKGYGLASIQSNKGAIVFVMGTGSVPSFVGYLLLGKKKYD